MKYIIVLIGIFLFNFSSYSQCTRPYRNSIIKALNLEAHTTNNGGLFADISNSQAGLNYPKLTNAQIQNGETAASVIFSGGIWLSAKDNGNLQVSAHRYVSSTGYNFTAGPIDLSTGTVNSNSCGNFENIWSIDAQTINNFKNYASSNTYPLDTSKIDFIILDWPAKGSKYFRNGYLIKDNLAPFVDKNNNGIYDPDYGDYPLIKGDRASFWVINDLGSSSREPTSTPIGVEVQFMAYVIDSIEYKNSLFYDCKVIKKKLGDAQDFIFGLYIDPDLGNFSDDYIGCDTSCEYAFTYNADAYDQTTSVKGYGANPPIVFTSFINAPMSAFVFFTNALDSSGLSTDVEYRNFMEGKLRSGGSFTQGGNGIGGTIPTKYIFTGNPSNAAEWSMASAGFPAQDLRYLQNSKLDTLKYNTPYDFSFMVNIFETYNYTANYNIKDSFCNKITKIKNKIRAVSKECNLILQIETTSDTNNLGVGVARVLSIANGTSPYTYSWSSGEKAEKISNKNSGTYTVTVVDKNNCSKIVPVKISNLTPTSHTQILAIDEASISIYPNPTLSQLIISSTKPLAIDELSIYDIVGKNVLNYKDLKINREKTLDVRGLKKGIYILTIKHGSLYQHLKFEKE